jgi:hypothetical protein
MPLENTLLSANSHRPADRQSPREVNIYAIITLGALGLIFLLMAGPVLLFVWHSKSRPLDFKPISFESQAWKRADPIEHYRTVRSQMVDDLLKRKLLDGLSRKEVEQLLGPPLADIAGVGLNASHWHMAYHLGMDRSSYGFDSDFLVFRFDERDMVIEYRTVSN